MSLGRIKLKCVIESKFGIHKAEQNLGFNIGISGKEIQNVSIELCLTSQISSNM